MNSSRHPIESTGGRSWLVQLFGVIGLSLLVSLLVGACPSLPETSNGFFIGNQPTAVAGGAVRSRPPVLPASTQSPQGFRARSQSRCLRPAAQLIALQVAKWRWQPSVTAQLLSRSDFAPHGSPLLASRLTIRGPPDAA